MKDKSNSIAKVLRLNGYLMPTNEEEVKAFEEKHKKNYQKPENWNNPLEILKKGKVEKLNLKSDKLSSSHEANSLAMAARDGKEISEDVRKKMKEDRNYEESKK